MLATCIPVNSWTPIHRRDSLRAVVPTANPPPPVLAPGITINSGLFPLKRRVPVDRSELVSDLIAQHIIRPPLIREWMLTSDEMLAIPEPGDLAAWTPPPYPAIPALQDDGLGETGGES